MKEAIFIIVLILIVLGLTALRYRKQIASMIGMARLLREAKKGMSAGPALGRPAEKVGVLAHCETCGVNFPEERMMRIKGKRYCSNECSAAALSRR